MPGYARNGTYAAFAQDDFKVSRKLTFNLGVRWDLFLPESQRYNQKTWIDYAVPNPGANNILGALNSAHPGDELASTPTTINSARASVWPTA